MLKIDNTKEENFEPKNFELMPKGIYRFQVGHKLAVVKCKPPSTNNMIKLILTCVDDVEDGKYLGRKVFDNLVLIDSCEFKLNAFAISSGLYTAESLKQDGQIDTEDFEPNDYEIVASIDIETSEYRGKTSTNNVVKAYMFKKD